jgi:hypothetical protein
MALGGKKTEVLSVMVGLPLAVAGLTGSMAMTIAITAPAKNLRIPGPLT